MRARRDVLPAGRLRAVGDARPPRGLARRAAAARLGQRHPARLHARLARVDRLLQFFRDQRDEGDERGAPDGARQPAHDGGLGLLALRLRRRPVEGAEVLVAPARRLRHLALRHAGVQRDTAAALPPEEVAQGGGDGARLHVLGLVATST